MTEVGCLSPDHCVASAIAGTVGGPPPPRGLTEPIATRSCSSRPKETLRYAKLRNRVWSPAREAAGLPNLGFSRPSARDGDGARNLGNCIRRMANPLFTCLQTRGMSRVAQPLARLNREACGVPPFDALILPLYGSASRGRVRFWHGPIWRVPHISS